jgi:hypothetical protein
MSNKRSAVKPSEFANVALKNCNILYQGRFQYGKSTALRHGQKKINAGAGQ